MRSGPRCGANDASKMGGASPGLSCSCLESSRGDQAVTFRHRILGHVLFHSGRIAKVIENNGLTVLDLLIDRVEPVTLDSLRRVVTSRCLRIPALSRLRFAACWFKGNSQCAAGEYSTPVTAVQCMPLPNGTSEPASSRAAMKTLPQLFCKQSAPVRVPLNV